MRKLSEYVENVRQYWNGVPIKMAVQLRILTFGANTHQANNF